MTKYLPWLGGGLAVFLLLAAPQCWSPSGGWEVDTATTMADVRAREAQADAQIALGRALIDSAVTLRVSAQHQKALGEAAYRSAMNLRDSLSRLPAPPDTCLPWLLVARQGFDSLRVGYDSLSRGFEALAVAYAAQDTALTLLWRAYDLRGASIDSLKGLVRRAPRERWWVPTIHAGYGAVVSDGAVRVGPGLLVGWKLRF